MNVSTLSIKVVSDGIKDAADGLKNLTNEARSANTSVNTLTKNVEKLGTTFGALPASMSNAISQLNAANSSIANIGNSSSLVSSSISSLNSTISSMASVMTSVNSSMSSMASAMQNNALSIAQLNQQMASLTANINQSGQAASNAGNGGHSIFNNTLRSMATAALAYMSINMAKKVIEDADAWVLMGAKLQIATGSMQAASAAQQDLFELSQKLMIPMADAVQLYTRMTPAMQKMGKSAEDTKGMVESMGLALKLSGATAQEASSVMLQFSQSMNAGRLNGGEFNAVAEGAPIILRAIETELRRTGEWGENTTQTLKKMGSEGKISAQLLADAMTNALPKFRADFETIPVTVDGAMIRVKNAWEKAIGEISKNEGLGASLVKNIEDASKLIPPMVGAIVTSLKFLSDNAGIVATLLGGAVVAGLVAMGAAAVAAVTPIIALGAAFVATTASIGLATAAANLFAATPVGAIIAAITLAVGAGIGVWALYKKATEGSAQANVDYKVSSDKFIEQLKAENEQAKKNYETMFNIKKLKDEGKETTSQPVKLEELSKSLQTLEAMKLASRDAEAARKRGQLDAAKEHDDKARLLALDYAKIKALEDETASLNKVTAEEGKRKAQAVEAQKLYDKYGKDNADKRKEALADLDKQAFKDGIMIMNAKEYAKTVAGIKEKFADDKSPAPKKVSTSLDPIEKANKLLEEQLQLKVKLEAGDVSDKKLTASEKMVIQYEAEITQLKKRAEAGDADAKASAAGEIAIREKAIAIAKTIKAYEDENEAVKENIKNKAKNAKTIEDEIDWYDNETLALRMSVDENMKLARAKEEVALATAQATLAAQTAPNSGASAEDIARTQNLIDSIKRYKEAQKDVADDKVMKKAGKDLDALLDPTKAKSFGDIMKDSFNGAGSSIGKAMAVLADYGKKQAEIAKEQKLFNESGKTDQATQIEITRRKTQMTLASYGDMAAAGKAFFKEGTNGYKALEAAERTFRAFEMALAISNFVQKSGLTAAFTGLFVAGKTAETAAAVEGAAAETAATEGVNIVKAIGAVLTQGGGDPYTAFARMAAMVAAVAALGYAVAGGGKAAPTDNTAEFNQKNQGAGTVLGDVTAKSDSISKSLEYLNKLSENSLSHTISMDNSLKTMVQGISGVASILSRTQNGGIVNGTNLGITEGTLARNGINGVTNTMNSVLTKLGSFGDIINGIFGKVGTAISNLWGKTTQSIVDSGVKFQGTLSQLMNKQGYSQYANVNTTTSSWFGLSKDTTASVVQGELDKQVKDQFSLVFSNLNIALIEASKGLGMNAEEVKKSLEALNIDTSISLKGLSGEALEKAISSVFSNAADKMATATFAGIDEFQKVGEGAFETFIRISSDLTNVNASFKDLGYALLPLGAAGVRSAEGLITLFGSLETMQSLTASYLDKYYTSQEKAEAMVRNLTEAFSSLGLTLPDTKDELRKMVEAAHNLGTKEGDALYVNLIKLAGAYDDMSSTVKTAKDEAVKSKDVRELELKIMEASGAGYTALLERRKEEIKTLDLSLQPLQARLNALEDEKKTLDLALQIMELTGKSAEALKIKRERELSSMSASDQALQKRIWKLEDEKEITDKISDAELEIYKLTHTAAQVTAAERKKELQAMDESLRPLQERVYKLQDEADALKKADELAKKSTDLKIQIMELEGNTTGANAAKRKIELDAMDESLRPLQLRIYALQDEKVAADAAKKASEEKAKADANAAALDKELKSTYEADQKTQQSLYEEAVNKQIDIFKQAADKANAFAKAVRTLKENLLTGTLTTLSPEESYKRVKDNLSGTIAKAQGGDTEALNQLQQFLEISRSYNASTQGYVDDFNLVTKALDEMSGAADTAEAIAKAQLAALQNGGAIVNGLTTINGSILNMGNVIGTAIAAGATMTYQQAKEQFEKSTGTSAATAASLIGKNYLGGDVSYNNSRLRAYGTFNPDPKLVEEATKKADEMLAKFNKYGVDVSGKGSPAAGVMSRQDVIDNLVDLMMGAKGTIGQLENNVQAGLSGAGGTDKNAWGIDLKALAEEQAKITKAVGDQASAMIAKYNVYNFDTNKVLNQTTGEGGTAWAEKYVRQALMADGTFNANSLSSVESLIKQLYTGEGMGSEWKDKLKEMSSVDGSHKDGLDYVPFDNYKANLHKGEAVVTAEGVNAMALALPEMAEILSDIREDIRGSMALEGEIATTTLKKLDKVVDGLDDVKRAVIKKD